jgi:hypothetical protein
MAHRRLQLVHDAADALVELEPIRTVATRAANAVRAFACAAVRGSVRIEAAAQPVPAWPPVLGQPGLGVSVA